MVDGRFATMTWKGKLILWFVASTVLICIIGLYFGDWVKAIYFVTILLPIVIGSSLVFNEYLLPNYFLTQRMGLFILYTLYVLIFTGYLLMLIILASYVFYGDFQLDSDLPFGRDVLWILVYLFLTWLVEALYTLSKRLSTQTHQIESLLDKKEIQKEPSLTVTSQRKQLQIPLIQILFIESRDDYVLIQRVDEEQGLLVYARISHLQKELPPKFIRTHRSFIVNSAHITQFNKKEVWLGEIGVPISRSYKEAVMEFLEKG